jgi:peroxiredoxin Q/BCP
MPLKTGQSVPDLSLPATGDQTIALRAFKGRALVIYFYPKDATPGCTQEGQDFAALHEDFTDAGAVILGISRDSVRKHENFAAKHGFPFALLSDADEVACKAFDVIKEKRLYGKTYLGIDRSTFLFDRAGKLVREWRGVKVSGHAEEVLAAVRAL